MKTRVHISALVVLLGALIASGGATAQEFKPGYPNYPQPQSMQWNISFLAFMQNMNKNCQQVRISVNNISMIDIFVELTDLYYITTPQPDWNPRNISNKNSKLASAQAEKDMSLIVNKVGSDKVAVCRELASWGFDAFGLFQRE